MTKDKTTTEETTQQVNEEEVEEEVAKEVSNRINDILVEKDVALQTFLTYTRFGIVPNVKLVKSKKNEQQEDETGENEKSE